MLCVFLPLTMMSGMAGIMFRQLGFIVSIIMIVSTTAALTLVPMLCALLMNNKPTTNKLYVAVFSRVNKVLDGISAGYSRMIGWCMNHKKLILALAVVIFAGVMALYVPKMKTEFFPNSDSGRLRATIELPIGTSQDVTRDVAARIYEKIQADVPEIEVLSYSFGQADSENAFASMQQNGTYLISMNINVGSMEDRKRTVSEIADVIRADLRLFPELNRFNVTEGGMGMGGRASVQLLLWMYRHKLEKVYRGTFVGIFLMVCFGARFLIEFVKNDQVAFEADMLLNMGQILSIPFIIAGAGFLVYAFCKKQPAYAVHPQSQNRNVKK